MKLAIKHTSVDSYDIYHALALGGFVHSEERNDENIIEVEFDQLDIEQGHIQETTNHLVKTKVEFSMEF